MSKKPQRDLIKWIFQNFINSLRPRKIKGTFVGEDYLGNKYYELPPQPHLGKRKATRWFESEGGEWENVNKELTAEWEAWLRGRRHEPPTKEELMKNLAIMHMKVENAAKLEKKFAKPGQLEEKEAQHVTGMRDFPQYDDYEIVPGKDSKSSKKE